jgi:hypothetical protein
MSSTLLFLFSFPLVTCFLRRLTLSWLAQSWLTSLQKRVNKKIYYLTVCMYSWERLLSRKSFLLSTILSFLLCASLVISVKADAAIWTQTYGGTGRDRAFSLMATP